jgi:hypothetical protein
MLSEHNPIAELIYQIQKKWIDDVSPYPELKLVRWLIKPEQARLYEGFLKLESTEHGAIPEVLVTMLTPFKNIETYSSSIISDWCKAFKDDRKTQEKLSAKRNASIWDPDFFLAEPAVENGDHDLQLLQMIYSFHKEMVDKSMRLVVALFPHSIHNMEGFKQWLIYLLKVEIPNEISFMIFDHIGENYFDKVFEKYPERTKTLHINLDLDGAIGKISKMGDPNSPEVKLRECILEMGQSLQKNNRKRLDEWGEKALQITQKSVFKSMYATAHIVYAGMLFNFRQFDKIDFLLDKGLTIARQGLKAEAPSCKPLIIQFYGYIASSKQLQKRMKESILAFEKQGDMAVEYGLPGMALTPYRQAYTLSRKHLPERHDASLQKAFSTGKSMQPEEQLNSCYAAIAFDYMQWKKAKQKWEEADRIDMELKEIFGIDWKEQANNAKTSYPRSTKDVMPVN